ncbi:MAG: terminase [Candidatus Paraimprobicoccus trichonymphae]|uniref:Terminase n=1 Tax=Candidatus Paraimprobicoccus trichonymphae TaxID=3033793 RepID=A0AA48IHJ4_9FIRM|nr:MAG: terminase [Candidatus Paraimprobicoccus trichonymphae]
MVEVYAYKVVNNEIPAPKYVKKQCEEFIKIYENKSEKYFVDFEKLKKIESILKILIMPRGLKAGNSIYACSCGYQWLFYVSILCVVYRDNPNKRRYETAILEVGRKNFKTFTIATIFVLLFLLEPKFSKFYSVAPDGALSREVKTAIEEILKSSPLIFYRNEVPRFKILRDYIKCNLNENKYFPLNYSNSKMDGKLTNVFLADEVGALPNSYAIESMRSGQLNILNKLGCVISTKYPTVNNPFEDEVNYAKQVLDGVQKDETVFALLYEPDDTENWTTKDEILQHANPVALEIPEIWEDLLKKRARALVQENSRENFLTKHCNIIYQGAGTESFIDIKYLLGCRVNKIDWTGREVYLGVDLSMSSDNTAVAMVSEEEGKILADVFCFIPEGRIEEKSQIEKLNYRRFIDNKKCVACGNKTIDYGVVEDFVLSLETEYGIIIKAIGFDRYNCMSSAQKWNKLYNTVEIRQHSDTLHPPTKLLTEKITNGEFEYEKNMLLEVNFENAKCTYDTNMNRYVTKKKSSGKVDMVVALINAVYLLQQDIIFEDRNFVFQII